MNYRKTLNNLLAEKSHLSRTIEDEEKNLSKAKKTVKDTEEALKVLQELAETIQRQVHKNISGVVSKCLSAVFEDPYEFRIIFEQKRGKTEARLSFWREGNEVDPMEASGGGCIDVAALALRLACIVMSKPKKRICLIADEPMKNISPKYRPLVPSLLQTLSKEMDLQIIMTTNQQEFVCGTVIDLSKE